MLGYSHSSSDNAVIGINSVTTLNFRSPSRLHSFFSGWSSDGVLKLFDFGLSVSVRAQRDRTELYRYFSCTNVWIVCNILKC